jgi:hypothetical protein
MVHFRFSAQPPTASGSNDIDSTKVTTPQVVENHQAMLLHVRLRRESAQVPPGICQLKLEQKLCGHQGTYVSVPPTQSG